MAVALDGFFREKGWAAILIGCTGQVEGVARTFGESAPKADSASGGFSRQLPHLPVTPAVMFIGEWS